MNRNSLSTDPLISLNRPSNTRMKKRIRRKRHEEVSFAFGEGMWQGDWTVTKVPNCSLAIKWNLKTWQARLQISREVLLLFRFHCWLFLFWYIFTDNQQKSAQCQISHWSECYELNTMIKVSSWFNNLPECLIEFKMPRKIRINRISVRLRAKIFTHSSFVNSTRPPDFWERCERVCTWVSRAGLMRSRGV